MQWEPERHTQITTGRYRQREREGQSKRGIEGETRREKERHRHRKIESRRDKETDGWRKRNSYRGRRIESDRDRKKQTTATMRIGENNE
jgi:RNA-binding motif protein, X-linked 2